MKGWRGLLNSFHKTAAKSSIAVKAALFLRNQAECVIGYHLGEDAEVNDENNSEHWLVSRVAPSARTFVDVGANQGDWSRLFLQHSSRDVRGLLFEPNPRLADRLKSDFGQNPTIQITSEALSDHQGESILFIAPGDSKTSSLSKSATIGEPTSHRVQTSTLDDAAKRFGFEFIDILKIDAEGHDLNVIRGGDGLLRDQRIALVQFEYGNAWPFAGNTLAAALDYLKERNYQVFLLKQNRLQRFSYPKYREYFRYSTFVAMPGSRTSEFETLIVPDV